MMLLNSRKIKKTLIRILFAIMLITGSQLSVKAQFVPVVAIDPHSRVVLQTAPFDRSFYLLLPVDTALQLDAVKQVSLYNRSKKQRENNQLGDVIVNYSVNDLKSAYFVDTPKVEGFKYLKVIVNKQLAPNTRFSVILFLNATAGYYDQLNDINMDLSLGNVAKAKSDYHDLANQVFLKYSSAPVRAKWEPFDKEDTDTIYSKLTSEKNPSYHQYFLDHFQSIYQSIPGGDSAILNNLVRLKDTLKSDSIRIQDLFECNCQKDFVANELFSDSTKFLIPLQNLLNVDSVLPYFAAGKLNIQEFEPYKVARDNDLDKRIDYLSRLKASLLSVSYFFHMSSYAGKVPFPVRKGIYNSILPALAAIDKRIAALTEASAGIRKAMNGNFTLFQAELSIGFAAPFGQDIKTAAGNYIIADFGLAAAGTFVGTRYSTVARPYLGVNFSFIPIDKSVPLSSIQRKKFLHHLSAVLGLTTSPLTRQGTGDLISNMSVVTGVAYRLTRGLRFTSGVLIYKRDNANPVLGQSVTFGPMVALSLDLEIASWLGDLKAKLF